MSKPKVLSLSPMPAGVIAAYIAPYLQGKEVEIIAPEDKSESALAEMFKQVDIVLGDFSFVTRITKNIVTDAKNIKLIQQPSVGYQHIDIEACAAEGIPVANTAGANDIGVAEHTIMLAMVLLKKLFYAHQKTNAGEWVQQEMFGLGVLELFAKTWGIIGLGKIGKEVAKRINVFGTKIIYYDKFKGTPEREKELNVTFRPLQNLLRESDIISLHLPLTEETKHLISEQNLRLIKPSTILINVARGELIDEIALSKALKRKMLSGAGLDVFTQEPITKDNPFLNLPNVVLTPHIAGATNESRGKIIEKAVANVLRVLNGEKPIDVVNGIV